MSGGSLDIWADTALLMPDQSLVLGSSVRIKDRPAEETMSQTLDMTLDGVLVFEGVPLPDDGSGTLTLVAGSATGYGTASLNYGDAGLHRQQPDALLRGNDAGLQSGPVHHPAK